MAALMLLHGFTGHPLAWQPVVAQLDQANMLCPSLIDHAGAEPPELGHYSFHDEVDRLARLLQDAGKRAHLVGYSMGGRLALGIALRHPALVARLTLIGANPGLQTTQLATQRAASDELWALQLEREGLRAFVAAWEAQALFQNERLLSDPTRDGQRKLRSRHDPNCLARCLRSLGLARMPNYWPALAALQIPVDLVAGSEDAKFRAINARIAERCNAFQHVVPAAGHNVLLEQPAFLVQLIQAHDQQH